MRKILNLVLVFVMSLAVAGIGLNAVKAEATTDVTITVHIHQFDGVYTNTGIGVWDGQNWNGWGAVQSSVDEFGAVVVLNYTAAEINAVMDSIQFEISSNSAGAVDADAQAAYLSPGDGKTFLDVTSLKDGSVTALDVYYVQGATEFVPAADGFGQIFVVYTDPTVAANLAVYDTWSVWTWNNGTLGTASGPGDDEGIDWAADLVNSAADYDVAMKLVVLNVAADADSDTGFIVRTDDWTKQCATDIEIDNTTVRGSGTLVYYYQADSCTLETDGTAYLADVGMKFEMNAGNRFLESNIITSPTTIDVELLMPQNPGAYDVSRFTLKDSDGVSIPLVSAEVDTMDDLGAFTSDTVCDADENKFILYVKSSLDHSLLGVVGSLQGWDPANAVLSTKDDENGLAVFEICTTDVAGEFKLLFDQDNDGFTWDGAVDLNVTADNQSFDFGGERMGYFYIDANVPTVTTDFVGTFVSDYTPLVDEKILTIHFETTEARDKISVVGAFVQDWAPDAVAPYISTKDDTSGYAVFEVPSMNASGEFKILFDGDDNGFAWGDTELTSQFAYDFGEEDTLEIFINADGTIAYIVGGTAVATSLETTKVTLEVDVANELQPGNDYYVDYEQLAIENHITVYVDSDLDHTMLGLVGSVQGWDITSPIVSTQDSSLGYAVFEFVITEDSGEFKILFDSGDDVLTLDVDESGFNWGDPEVTPGDNVAFEVGESGVLVLFLEPTPLYDAGTFTSDFTPGVELVGTDLFFTEYAEADGGSCKYVELFNPTLEAIDLTGYTIVRPDEGLLYTSLTYVDTLVGTVESGEAFLIAGSACGDAGDASAATWTAVADQISFSAVAYFNGDDVLGLFNGEVLLDTIGQEGELAPDTGASWFVGDGDLLDGYTMENVTMVRAPRVTNGEADWEIAQLQWIVLADDRDYSDAGVHTSDAPVAAEKTVIIHLDTVYNGMDIAVVGDFVQSWDPASLTPYYSSKVDSEGFAVFEVPTYGETGEFKILLDQDDNGFNWGDDELTVQFAYDLDGQDVIEYVINAAGDMITMASGYNVPSVVGQVITDMALVGDITQVLFAGQYQTEVVMSNVLPYGLSNELVAADVVNEMGTYAVSKTEIALEYLNINTMLDSLELVDGDGMVIPFESINYTNNQIGAYTETLTCTVDENLLIVHLYLSETVPTVAAPLGLVGSVQGWAPENAVASTGMDANGNYVFEVCVANTETEGTIKILQDFNEDGFAWGDVEMTPGDIMFDFDGTTHVYVEEGGNAAGSAYQTIMLSDANMLDVTKTYMLKFVDENGFVVMLDLDIDNQAPEVQASFVIDVEMEVDQNATFDLMDYFTQLLFLDNRDGELSYTIVTDIDTAVVGEQTVVISATDMWDNTGTAEYTFTVIDTVNPVITLSAAPDLEVGDAEPDWNTFITVDEGTIVIDSSQVDMDVAGTYYISFTVTDAEGNVSSDSLEITVDPEPVPVCTDDQELVNNVCVDVEPEPEDDTGCFGSIGNSSALIIIGTFAVLGGAALFFIRKP